MEIAILLILTLIVVWVLVKRKNIYFLEAIAIWMIASLCFQDITGIIAMNNKWIDLPHRIHLFWAATIDRVLFMPALIVLYIDIYATIQTVIKRSILTACWVVLLVVDEYLNFWSGFVRPEHWNIGSSIIESSIVLLIVLIARRYLHFLFTKEGYKHDYF